MKKKIAIVGAGLFGCTIALILSKKHEIDLYETKSDILNEASMCNQFRFHLGFHYPRSTKTVNEIQKSNKSFIDFYGKNIFGNTNNFYGVVKNAGLITFKKYIVFLKKNNLNYKLKNNCKLISDKIDGTIISDEKILNYFKIKKKIKNKLIKSTVNLKLNSHFSPSTLKYQDYDKIIIATYKSNNEILKKLGFNKIKKFRYELIEKIAILLPKIYKKISFVIMDGKFICVDPYLGTPYHLLSHVKYSKIKIVKKTTCNFSKKNNKKLIDVKSYDIKKSNFKKFIKDGSKYLPFLKYAKYKFSYYVVRTLKLNVEKTDDRTNLTQFFDNKIITVLSGKWNTCVNEAHKINKLLN